ncbi:MAG: LuxR C-terminal-related transcriptional regulator [Aeromicrobium sp.]
MGNGLERGRDAFDRQAWKRAYEHLAEAEAEEPLEVDDLERLAASAYLAGMSDQSAEVWSRGHLRCAEIGDIARAARFGFWLAFAQLNQGDLARGGGWVDRTRRLLDENRLDCVEQGYVRYASAMRAIFSGDPEAGYRGFHEAVAFGERFRDRELITLARIGEGRCLIYLGDVSGGIALLDEAMVAVGAREISPIATGDAYCTVIDGCFELFDVARANAWTADLSAWCDTQPELVLYKGECLMHNAELMLLQGHWSTAVEEFERDRERLVEPADARIRGPAWFLRGELHRLRGEHADAEDGYRHARESGYDPQLGIAMLRLAQGRRDDAAATIRRALGEAEDPLTRTRVLTPFVEIMIAADDVPAARAAADELGAIAGTTTQPLVHAMAEGAAGHVLLAEGDANGALHALRRALRTWHDVEAPYEEARVRVRLALACRAEGDADTGDMELDAARSVFTTLGAASDLAWIQSLADDAGELPDGVTKREAEVLALVAEGLTNRQIAQQLVISEKTVASHLAHVFTKVGLQSRAAATAYAIGHGLTRGPGVD